MLESWWCFRKEEGWRAELGATLLAGRHALPQLLNALNMNQHAPLLIHFSDLQSKTPLYSIEQKGGLGCKSLTMTYFHTGTRTIIGAKSFHCPVRDGKEWYQLAMVIRHNLVSRCFWSNTTNS